MPKVNTIVNKVIKIKYFILNAPFEYLLLDVKKACFNALCRIFQIASLSTFCVIFQIIRNFLFPILSFKKIVHKLIDLSPIVNGVSDKRQLLSVKSHNIVTGSK